MIVAVIGFVRSRVQLSLSGGSGTPGGQMKREHLPLLCLLWLLADWFNNYVAAAGPSGIPPSWGQSRRLSVCKLGAPLRAVERFGFWIHSTSDSRNEQLRLGPKGRRCERLTICGSCPGWHWGQAWQLLLVWLKNSYSPQLEYSPFTNIQHTWRHTKHSDAQDDVNVGFLWESMIKYFH